MKRTHMTLAAAFILSAALPAAADDTFGPAAVPAANVDLCQYHAVREIGKIDRQLQPVKEIAGIVTNPEGFVIHEVDQHIVHVPAWVGYAMNPRGAIRAKVIDVVRAEMKKNVGLKDECAGPGEAGPAHVDDLLRDHLV